MNTIGSVTMNHQQQQRLGIDRTKEFFQTAERVSKQLGRSSISSPAATGIDRDDGNGRNNSASSSSDVYDGQRTAMLLNNNDDNNNNNNSNYYQFNNEDKNTNNNNDDDDDAKTKVRNNKKSIFHQRASGVGHAIHSTSQKLERLAQLAKRSGMFDDSTQEINTISFAVKEDIKQLNNAIAELQQIALRDKEIKTKQSNAHSNTIVESLKGRLMDATRTFKDVLSERRESVKNNERRRSMFGGGSSTIGVGVRGGEGMRAPPGRFASVNAAATTGSFMNVGSHQHQQQQEQGGFNHMTMTQSQVAVYQDQDQNYANSRADAMQNVERTITELGGIFQQLATMVNEQGEMAIRIDENIEDVVMNVDNAQGELLKYLNYISSNRWLAMKVFGVLMFFLMFFIVFVA